MRVVEQSLAEHLNQPVQLQHAQPNESSSLFFQPPREQEVNPRQQGAPLTLSARSLWLVLPIPFADSRRGMMRVVSPFSVASIHLNREPSPGPPHPSSSSSSSVGIIRMSAIRPSACGEIPTPKTRRQKRSVRGACLPPYAADRLTSMKSVNVRLVYLAQSPASSELCMRLQRNARRASCERVWLIE